MIAVLAWLALVGAAPDCPPVVGPSVSSTAALQYSALGFQHLRAGGRARAAAAVTCLRAAQRGLPDSAMVSRDLATAYIRLERWSEAIEALALARRQGAAGPELELMAAVVAARFGASKTALRAAETEGSWRGDIIAARYGSSSAKDRLLALTPESTQRAAWGSLALSMVESRAGDLPAARQLAADAERTADAMGLSALAVSARALGKRFMADASGWQGRLRLRSSLEHTTNPGYVPAGDELRAVPLRLALSAVGGVSRSFGRWIASGAVRVDQDLFLTERDRLGSLDLFQLSVAAGLRYPLSSDPNGTVLGLVARYRDAYGDRFGEHLGYAIEGGPELRVRVTGAVQARLALYGLLSELISRSPPDAVVSAVNRDRVGQRALLTFHYRTHWMDGRIDALFLRDQAEGEAFDAVGGGLGLHGWFELSAAVWLNAGASVTLREYGPVGDAAVIGDAATRPELRTTGVLGARWALGPRLYAIVQDSLVMTFARSRHRYIDNVLSVGVEAEW